MKKELIIIILSVITQLVFADDDDHQMDIDLKNIVNTSNSNYIATTSYIQNPYISLPSSGGTQNLTESSLLNQSVGEKLFMDGTWNILSEGSYLLQNGVSNVGYGANVFGQTGQIAGFSAGGLVTVLNPVVITPYAGNLSTYAQTLPVTEQIAPTELFAEYQYAHTVQVDAGWIGIPNSPWMTYYQNNVLNVVSYQGALVNITPGAGWQITGFAINGAQLISENGMSGQTMYNSIFDNGTATSNIGSDASPGTVALGANWANASQNFTSRVWGYQFYDYANLLYADAGLKIPSSSNLNFNIGLQALTEGANGANILNNAGYGSVNSNAAGLQLGLNYKKFGLQLGYNNIWGPSGSYSGGGIVSPYTYQYATDPLYTTGFLQGMVEYGAGNAYKITPSLTILDNSLVLNASYIAFNTINVPATSEYDFTANYAVPQIKGLNLFGAYGYIDQHSSFGINYSQAQLLVSYLY